MSRNTIAGSLGKMHSDLLTGTEDDGKSRVAYQLPIGDQLLPLNGLLDVSFPCSTREKSTVVTAVGKPRRVLTRVFVTLVLKNYPSVTTASLARKSATMIRVPVVMLPGEKRSV